MPYFMVSPRLSSCPQPAAPRRRTDTLEVIFSHRVVCRENTAPTTCFVTPSNPADFPLNLTCGNMKCGKEAASLAKESLFFPSSKIWIMTQNESLLMKNGKRSRFSVLISEMTRANEISLMTIKPGGYNPGHLMWESQSLWTEKD